MIGFAIRRVIIALPVIALISIVGFTILAIAPGDPITARIERETLLSLSPEEIAERRSELGFDGPIHEQYVAWLGDVIRGDLGYSIMTGRPVTAEIGARIGPTLLLMGVTLIIAIGIGIPLGIIAAARQNGPIDYVLTSFSMVTISVPTFLIGLIAIYLFAVTFKVLPAGGLYTVGREDDPLDLLRHVLMPALILGLASAAPLARYTRASMLDALNGDHMVTARAKGLDPRTALLRHGLRNALLPIITLVALLLPELVAGAVITEQVFGWPGIGRLTVQAAQDRDPAVMMAIIMIIAVTVAVANLLADIAYGIADPRVRLASR
jgi:peptide/nickel transport system permease protein